MADRDDGRRGKDGPPHRPTASTAARDDGQSERRHDAAQSEKAPPAPHASSLAKDDLQDSVQSAANVRGMMMMAFAMGAFALNDTLTKTASSELPTGEILAIRGAFAVAVLAPIVSHAYGLRSIPRAYCKAILVRNISEIFAVFLFLSALFRLPVANVTSILQALPLTMTAAAALLLKEPVGWRRWTAASVGLLGVLVIMRPGTVAFSWWYLAAVVAVVFITARDMSTKFIDRSTPSLVIALITAGVVMCAGLGAGLIESWVVPSTGAVVRLALAAVFVLLGYYSLIECWRDAEISAVAPFRYTIVLWSMMTGYMFLGEVPQFWTIVGSMIVVGAGMYTFHRERLRKKMT